MSNPNPTLAQLITFDATAVTDPDSAITGYDWDFDGNGSVDRTTATPTTRFEYGATGSFNPVVHVKDFRGGQGTATTPVTVSALPPAPPAGPGPPPTLGPLPSLSLPARGTGGLIRPSVRCALRCSVNAKLVVSRATARKLKLKRRTLARFRRTLTTTDSAAPAVPRPRQGAARGEAGQGEDHQGDADRHGDARRRALEDGPPDRADQALIQRLK